VTDGLDIAFFGSSLVSAWWNGACTYYRGIIRNLHSLGHRVTFYEPDAFDRQAHRDIGDPDWATVVVYRAETEAQVRATVATAAGADVVVKASGVGAFDEVLEAAVLERADGALTIFWDVDAPATITRMERNAADPFRSLVPCYDLIFTYGGGEPVVRRYRMLGARQCIVVGNALDPWTHFPVNPDDRFRADLGLLANRLPDREDRVDEFFFRPASTLRDHTFLLAGNGWATKKMPANVRSIGHLGTGDHNSFNSTPTAVLNVTRSSMVANGYSPATRVFEAAGAAACLITDEWDGIAEFLEPDAEVLVARDGAEVAERLSALDETHAEAIGDAARTRVLAQHTYAHRARQVDRILRAHARSTSR